MLNLHYFFALESSPPVKWSLFYWKHNHIHYLLVLFNGWKIFKILSVAHHIEIFI